MGSSTFLDIIGSTFVGGILLISALTLNASAHEYSAAYYSNYVLQSNLVTLVLMIENDFKHIGYCQNPSLLLAGNSILYASDTAIQYLTDVDPPDGFVDTVKYWTGSTSEFAGTSNPNMFYLYRQVNSQAATKWNLGLTQFRLKYWDNQGTPDPIPTPVTSSNLGTIRVTDLTVQLQSLFKQKQQYMNDTSEYQLYWKEMRMTSQAFRFPR